MAFLPFPSLEPTHLLSSQKLLEASLSLEFPDCADSLLVCYYILFSLVNLFHVLILSLKGLEGQRKLLLTNNNYEV